MKVTCSRSCSGRPAFTLVELLMVIVVIGMLAALLLPAIGSAMRKAREAAVQAEVNSLAVSLAQFRTKYGDYPPSRILLCEDGNYLPYLTGASASSAGFAAAGSIDQPTAGLAARSLQSLRRFWPRLKVSSSGGANTTATGFPDFNGNGTLDGPVVLTGDECLAFFLGGVARSNPPTAPGGAPSWVLLGVSSSSSVPFPPGAPGTARQAPLFEFKTDRLADLDGDGYPSYLDSLDTGRPYAYFSSYGGSGYDPNDCNFDAASGLAEADDSGVTSPITLKFAVAFPVLGGPPNLEVSPPPNPYATSSTTASPVGWINGQSFQIVSAGVDGMYGVGGLYSSSAPNTLPVDPAATQPSGDNTIRYRERDNLTNFHGSRLE